MAQAAKSLQSFRPAWAEKPIVERIAQCIAQHIVESIAGHICRAQTANTPIIGESLQIIGYAKFESVREELVACVSFFSFFLLLFGFLFGFSFRILRFAVRIPDLVFKSHWSLQSTIPELELRSLLQVYKLSLSLSIYKYRVYTVQTQYRRFQKRAQVSHQIAKKIPTCTSPAGECLEEQQDQCAGLF